MSNKRIRWWAAAVLTFIAALPAIALLAIQAGALERVRVLLTGVKTPHQPPLMLGNEANVMALAWAVFFGILALVYASETRPEVYPEQKPEVSEDNSTEPEGETLTDDEPERVSRRDAAGTSAQVRAESAPTAGDGYNLPVVPNIPEVEAWYNRGNRLFGMGRAEESIRCFDRALRIYPRFAKAWAAKGLACNALGQYQDAINCYDESLRLDPRDAAVWHDKGNTLCALNRLEGGLSCFNEALILDPRDARAWNNKGICLASLGRPEEGISCCDRAVKIDPSYALAWRAKGMVDERLGRIAEAVEAYKQFVKLASATDPKLAEGVQRHLDGLEVGPSAVSQPAATG